MARCFQFLFFVLFNPLYSTLCLALQNSCPHDQSLLLLKFKETFSVNEFSPYSCFQSAYPKTKTWNNNTDCCSWEGITCDDKVTTSNVVELDLSCSQLKGTIDYDNSLFQLSHLQRLNLAYNEIKSSSILGKFTHLRHLNLSSNEFSGQVPEEMFSNMTEIETIDLSSNRLIGSLPSFPIETRNLRTLNLANNSFSGTILPSWLFSLSSLEFLDLNSNQLYGHLPMELSSLVNLQLLDLSSNNFSGHVEVDIFSNMKQLLVLSLCHNRLSLVTNNSSLLPKSIHTLELASCNITDLEFLRSPLEYFSMDLSKNNIQEIPSWLWSKWSNMSILNISYNSITHMDGFRSQQITVLDIRTNLVRGPFPQVPASIEVLLISNNKFFGVIQPSVICKLSSIRMIDLSNNSFTGSIPQCVANMSQQLSVLDVHMNEFEGPIPSNFSSYQLLVTLNLHGNYLQGNIPSSLIKCINLKDLDLGHNNLNGTFPSWLGVLPELRVLNLRSNNFHGEISFPLTQSSFSKLQILDLSHNQFFGTLPTMLFSSFSGMKEIDQTSASASYIGDVSYYKESIILVNKGIQVQLTRILTIWTTIDLSYNNFEGNIPSSIGDLIYLRQLNVSNNRFAGEIPVSFGNLSLLESLDMSSNQLIGTIPTQLTTLHSLSKLNLSYNFLTGRIPGGPQFQTFENDSYIGNDGLCGHPFSRICIRDEVYAHDVSQSPEQDDSYFTDGFSLRSVLIGYGVGVVLGLGIGWFMFITGKPKHFIKFVEEEQYRIVMKRDRKKKNIQTHCKKELSRVNPCL